MRLIMGGVNGNYLGELTENALKDTDRVWAAVAYATEGRLLFEWCLEHHLPLRFWGRFDDATPVSTPILEKFLQKASPNFECKLIRQFHAKVIWWKGYGVYIGSANLSNAAWYNNIEAGCFFEEAEIATSGMEDDLLSFFRKVDEKSSPLNAELFALIKSRALAIVATKTDKERSKKFLDTGLAQKWDGLGIINKKTKDEEQKNAFLDEWYSTLQIIRNIAKQVSDSKNRPMWISADTPDGSQADQFLHAHYDCRTFDGKYAKYEEHFSKNNHNPAQAVNEAIKWWKNSIEAPSNEERTLNEWAPLLHSLLSEERLRNLSEDEFEQICHRVHSIKDHARRVANRVLSLRDGDRYSIDEKASALANFLYSRKTSEGHTVLEVLHWVLYGGAIEDVPHRLWAATKESKWKIDHLGVSAIGEIAGWALPEKYPPRNGRTSKALRSLGYDVTVHSA